MPVPGGGFDPGVFDPAWQPTLTQVATYVPHRTLVRSDASMVESDDTYEFTFDTTTIPTGTQVLGLIADGVVWVQARVYPLNTVSQAAAGVCAALFAAAMIERSWPNDDQSLQRANDLERRLDSLLTDLVAANTAANTGANTGIPVSPMWSFPCPDRRWDYAGYW